MKLLSLISLKSASLARMNLSLMNGNSCKLRIVKKYCGRKSYHIYYIWLCPSTEKTLENESGKWSKV